MLKLNLRHTKRILTIGNDGLTFFALQDKMSVWEVYYRHWAKEANETRIEAYRRSCADKMMLLVVRQWFYGSDEKFMKKYWKMIQQTIKDDMPFYQDERRRMQLISDMAEKLSPKTTPRETDFLVWRFEDLEAIDDRIQRGASAPGFVLIPSEIRFWRNMGKRQEEMYTSMLLDAKGAHRLDAILALM